MPTDILDIGAIILALVVAGGFAGFIAGLLGVGGGIVLVPTLYWLLPLFGTAEAARMHMAVGTSLATIIATSAVSARGHARRGAIDGRLVRQWIVPVCVGVAAGTLIAVWAPGNVLTGIFAVVAFLVALNMGLRPGNEAATRGGFSRPLAWLAGTLIGCFSVLMGIGGGTLTVPVLSAVNYPIRTAVGTAALIGLVIAVPGTAGFLLDGLGQPGRPAFSLGYINLLGVICIIPATMSMAPRGVAAAHNTNPRLLRRIFAIFLGLTALRMGLNVFG